MEVINGQNTCELCTDLAREGETLQERADRTNPYILRKEEESK
jgi:hypothetical protein